MGGVHQHGFLGRDVKEFRIEVSGIIHEAPVPTGHGAFAGACRWMLGAVVLLHVKAIGGDLLVEVNTFQDHVPESFEVIAAWSFSGHADDGDTVSTLWGRRLCR